MYWCRCAKKVHRPLIAIAVIGFMIVTASHVKFEQDDAHRNSRISSFSDDELLLGSMSNGGNKNEEEQIIDPMSTIPVPPVRQLPYCNSNRDKTFLNSVDDANGQDRDNSSDEVVLSSSARFDGRHVLVSTLDGQLSLLDHGGRILWTIGTGELFSSTISTVRPYENTKVKFIPSLTGGLYKYDGDSLVPMPLNAETLLRRSYRLSNDVVMTGGKEIRTYGVDLTSGTIRYECGMEGCVSQTKAESRPKEDVVLVVKKQLQTVRAIDSASGSERWNFSVGTHELALAGITEGCYEGEQKESEIDQMLKVVIPEGLVIGADKATQAVWQHKFSSPISQAWVLDNGKLKVVDPIKNSARLEESPALYIGLHHQQFYVQESHSTAEKLENAFAVVMKKYSDAVPVEIGWKPSAAIEGIQDNKALAPYEPNKFSGVYVMEKEELKKDNSYIDSEDENLSSDDSDTEAEEGQNGNQYVYTVPIFMSLWCWWKEVLGISLLTAIILNIVLMRPVIRAVRTQTVREMWDFFRNFRTKQQEELAILPRKDSHTLELPFTQRTRTRTVSSSSNASQMAIGEDGGSQFSSQYLREFDPIQCLGRGGFGVVFEAKKKIDDRNYAVKRIPLPNREKSRDKVMREVKALAKLDHRNIVRYFNAWIENPPLGWLERNDPLWDVSKPDPSSMNFLSSYGGCSSSELNWLSRRKDHSEISMPSKTPVEEQIEPEDSFIVFAAEGESDKEESSSKFSPQNENEGGSNWKSDGGDPFSVDESKGYDSSPNATSRRLMFVRPTSLDIPSSVEESSRNLEIDYDEGIETGIDAANNAEYTPSIMYLYIQQELCQKRTLQDWLRQAKDRNLCQVVNFFAQTVEAVEYIHLNKLIHRDLKPGNIFLASSVDSDYGSGSHEKVTVKIGDFGLATTAANWLDSDTHTPAGEQPPATINLTGHVGTHLYMSPEQSRNKPYDFKVDIYSLGLIFFELLVPFSTEMERHEALSQVRKMNFPSSFLKDHSEESKLISKMVSHRPEQRPNATEIKSWVKNHLLCLSPSVSCSPSSAAKSVYRKSMSGDSSVFPLKKEQLSKEDGRLLNKTQSCT